MAVALASLLGVSESRFAQMIEELERATGGPNFDIRLLNEVKERVRLKTAELGLDPQDTIGQELYHALQGRVAMDNARLEELLGVASAQSVDQVLRDLIDRLKLTTAVWVLKPSVAKRFLRAHPPKQLMKKLGYRSVESLLKRETIYELYGALRFAESAEWLSRLAHQYGKLNSSDFELRAIDLVLLPSPRWEHKLHLQMPHNQSIIYLPELGIIYAILPAMKLEQTSWLAIIVAILYAINEIRSLSAYWQFQQLKRNFGQLFMQSVMSGTSTVVTVVGQPITWKVLQKHFAGEGAYYPEIFEPHITPDDLRAESPQNVLHHLDPSLAFWRDIDWVGYLDGATVTGLHALDQAINYSGQVRYGSQHLGYFRESLWQELWLRYLAEHRLEQEVIKQFDQPITEKRRPRKLNLKRPSALADKP